ncbi:FHA domain-containing protein PS1 [Hirschfeldia incana]|nr:FHA domain-containing protein PS1 [Hirschfeldia incana]
MEIQQQVREKTIPVFTVLKNGAILKNIFVVNSRDFSSPERNGSGDDDEVEEILLVGRHPDCDILLTHPSISRYHLQIRSLPSRQKLFVTDLSSVHGTWVADLKVEPDACVEVKEGDVIRIGGSTRIYRLHWIPLSRAYDIDNPFVSPLHASTVTEQEEEEESRLLEADNLDQSQADNASGKDGDGHLDVTSEGSGSSIPSEDDDTYITTTREITLPFASPSVLTLHRDSVNTQKLQSNETSSKWDLDVVEAASENLSTQQSGSYLEVLGSSELEVADEWDVRGDEGLLLDVIESSAPIEEEDTYLAAKETSSLPLSRDSIETENLHLTDEQASQEMTVNIIAANTENTSSGSLGLEPTDGCFEASGCNAFELTETEFVSEEVMEASPELPTKTEIQSQAYSGYIEVSGKVFAVSPSCSPQAKRLLEVLAEDPQHLLGSEYRIEVSMDEMGNEENPAGDQNLKHGMNRESERIFDDGSSSCHSEDLEQSGTQSFLSLANLKPKKQMSFCSEASYNLSDVWGEGNTDKEVLFPSTLAPQTFEDIEKLPYTESQEIQMDQAHAVRDNALSQMNSSRRGKTDSVPLLEASGCPALELAAEVEILSLHEGVSGDIGFVTEKAVETSAEPLTEAEIQEVEENGQTEVLRQFIAVSSDSFPRMEPTLTGDAQGRFGSEVSNGETKLSASQASAVSDRLFAGTELISRFNTENIQSLCSSWQAIRKTEVEAPSAFLSEVNLAGDQNKTSAIDRDTEQIFDDGGSLCHSEDLEQCGPSTLAAEIFEDTKPTAELPSEYIGGQENQTPRRLTVRDDVLSEMDSSKSSSRRLSTSNIWSRRGKDASVLQVRTNKSEGKQKQMGKQAKAQLQRKQARSAKSIYLTADHGADKLEPEIFTPDKENLTPSSHMLKRLQDLGEIKDSKSSSKLSGKPSSVKIPSSVAIVASVAFTEPEIFTPDKENLTPNSHMLRRLREVGDIKFTKGSSSKAVRKPFFDIHVEENLMADQKPDVHCMSSNSKVKHEPVAPKKKAERAPFQPILEKSSSKSESYTEAPSTASARNKMSRGIRSSSNLSDGKNKMKWTIVLDTSSLLDKDSRKTLHLLQGLKGTHLVVPRTVIRELNETKRTRSVLFRRKADIASSALDWIEECKVDTKWWIQIQSSLEETKANAPTPPVTPQSNGSAFPFSLQWNNYAPEIDSPTSEDQVLECALLYRNRNNTDEKLVVLSNDVTLKIKAMAEGVICETALEFYESLKNPFSERFMWPESLPRGRTWSHADDVVLRERYDNRTCFPYRKKPMFNGGRRGESGTAAAAKGLKLILLHNSQYGHSH